jgi:anti-sigma B factor antagonist
MDVAQTTLHGIPLLTLAGEIGHEHSPRLRRALETAVDQGTGRLLLDLSAVPYIDSGCLGLIWVIVESVDKPGWLGVIGANQHIRRLFQAVGFEDGQTFRLFSTLQEAECALAYLESAA